jgi:hypothetical protein
MAFGSKRVEDRWLTVKIENSLPASSVVSGHTHTTSSSFSFKNRLLVCSCICWKTSEKGVDDDDEADDHVDGVRLRH